MRVVFIFNEYALHSQVLATWATSRPRDHVGLVKVPLVLKGKSRGETAKRIVPALSRRFLWGKIVEFLVLLLIVIGKRGRRGWFQRLRWHARDHDWAFHKSTDVMSEETLDFIRKQRPDVVITLFHQIVKPELIAIPRHGVINIHPGVLPDFRGIQPYFWTLSEGAERFGASLHLIEDATIDTGGILGLATQPVIPGMSVQLTYYLTMGLATRLLLECVEPWVQRETTPWPQDSGAGAYYKWPDSAAFDRLKARGHCLLSWRQLWRIIRGHYGRDFAEMEMEVVSRVSLPGAEGS